MQNTQYPGKFHALMGIALATLISGCASSNKITPIIDKSTHNDRTQARSHKPDLLCKNVGAYINKVVGDGHCVALVKRCAGAPNTSHWRPGPKVLNRNLKPGTVIATFQGQRYTSQSGQHAAVYAAQDSRGIWVWDQWQGVPVHKRLIRIRYDDADASNTAQAFRVVSIEN